MDLSRVFGGRKYMWDGRDYPERALAEETARSYRDQGFEVEICEDEDAFHVFTRRVVRDRGGAQQ